MSVESPVPYMNKAAKRKLANLLTRVYESTKLCDTELTEMASQFDLGFCASTKEFGLPEDFAAQNKDYTLQ